MKRGAGTHLPVMPDEVTFLLRPQRGGWVVDATVGMGGHAELLLELGGDGIRLLGIDRDPAALAQARIRLSRFGTRAVFRQANFCDLRMVAGEVGLEQAQAVLLDLGVSSYQLEVSGRGFSFQSDAGLDMRFDPSHGPTAADLLRASTEAELARIIFEYGEEPFARRIAREIVSRRRRNPLRTTGDLVAAVEAAVPPRARPQKRHVATRTFQAVRMAVNGELEALNNALPAAAGLLARGGRLGVISFHSGEDRVVKRVFRGLAGRPFALLEPTPLTPCREERRMNPRCRSAKFRVLERLEEPHGFR